MIELILGGARSGKSALAERKAVASSMEVVYLATATAGDDEMRSRIARHRRRRPDSWHLVEEPLKLADALAAQAGAGRLLLVDCLTLWLSNLLGSGDDSLFETQRGALLDTLPRLPGRVLLVSNEVGSGVVPMGHLTRRFVDEAGRLHQDLAALADRVTLVVAGLPHRLKGDPE